MKTPIRIYDPPCSHHTEIVDGDGKWVTQEEICDTINNAAAGPWLKGPAPDGTLNGELMLFAFQQVIVMPGYWNAKRNDWLEERLMKWQSHSEGHTMNRGEYLYAHINLPQPEKEATKITPA